MNPYLIIGALVAGIALFGGGYAKGRGDANAAHTIAMAEAAATARAEEQRLQGEINEQARQSKLAQDAILADRDDALARLRQRPDRLPDDSRAVCQGSTGAELSGADAEFLTREAARADQLRAALTACYNYADTLQGKAGPMSDDHD